MNFNVVSLFKRGKLAAYITIVAAVFAILEVISTVVGYSLIPGVVLEVIPVKLPKGAKDTDLAIFIHVEALNPPSWDGSLTPLYTGFYSGRPLYLPLEGELGHIVKGWIKDYLKRGMPLPRSALLIVTAVVNVTAIERDETSTMLLYATADLLDYSVAQLASRRTLRYTIWLFCDKAYGRPLIKSGEVSGLLRLLVEEGQVERVSEGSRPRHFMLGGLCGSFYCARLPWSEAYLCLCRRVLAPENITDWLPKDYFLKVNGTLYVKTPLVVVHNADNSSDIILVEARIPSRELGRGVAVYASIGVLRGAASVLTIQYNQLLGVWQSVGVSWGGKYYYEASSYVGIGRWWWSWIWARPLIVVYDFFYCTNLSCVPLNESIVVALVQDVLTRGYMIVGGSGLEKPPEIFIKQVTATSIWKLIGVLGYEDHIVSPELPVDNIVWGYVGLCGAKNGVAVPIGALLSAHGSPISDSTESLVAFFTSKDEDYEPNHRTFTLSVKNVAAYNRSVAVYVAISRVEYIHENNGCCIRLSCKYHVPVGLYIEVRSAGNLSKYYSMTGNEQKA